MPNMRTVESTIGSHKFNISSDDLYLDHVGEVFEPHSISIMECIIEKDSVILDVGANIGCTALFFSTIANEVHAFEPSPSTCELLRQNLKNNNAENVCVHNFGLGDARVETEITFAPSNRSGGFISNRTSASEGHQVESVTIEVGDEFAADNNLQVDFLKIDVEGFELFALRGLANTIAAGRPTAFIEMNHWCLNAFQRISIPEFIDEILSIFPIVFAVQGDRYADLRDTDHRYHVMYRHILHNEFQNLVCAFHVTQLDAFREKFSAI